MLTILSAKRIPPRIYNSRHTGAQLRGIRYQRALGKMLIKSLKNTTITLEPWYEYKTLTPSGAVERKVCAPDFLIEKSGEVIVIEAKLTFVYNAIYKLLNLYMPVVVSAHNQDFIHVAPLIITRTLTPSAPKTIHKFSQTFDSLDPYSVPVLQWLDKYSLLEW